MSAIAATGSSPNYSAVAQLLANSVSSTTDIPQTGPSGVSGSSATATNGSSDSLTLSDHAKSVLARAEADQVAANELQTFLQSARNPNGTGTAPASKPASDDVTQNFDQLTGQTQSQQASQQGTPSGIPSLADFQQADGGWGAGLADYLETLTQANQQPDGTLKNYSQTLNDVIAVPSTPQDIAAWYQSDGKLLTGQAEAGQGNDPGLVEAIANHAITFLNANDIPDLNFHNTIVLQGNENGGSSANQTWTYNQNASIFSDPSTSYKVLGDGAVIAWKTPPATGTTASN
jgi:hypothetical protein